MKYLGHNVKIHQFSNDWVMVDSLDDSKFHSQVLNPCQLREVTQSDVDAMKEHTNTGFFWQVFEYDQENERFQPYGEVP